MTLKEACQILAETYTTDDGCATYFNLSDEVFEAWNVIRKRAGLPPIQPKPETEN
jgi:hypothetical protein